MKRLSWLMVIITATLCFSSSYTVSAEESETDDCWVIVKENYEWIHEDEEMVEMHASESNLSYDSQCRLIEKSTIWYDMSQYEYTSFNDDGTISNTSKYWYDSDGDVIYLWEETFSYQDGVLTKRSWAEYSDNNGNYSLNQQQNTSYSYDSQGREILTNTTHGQSYYLVETTYDENGDVMRINSSSNGDLDNMLEYTRSSSGKILTETSTDYYSSGQHSLTTNYSYADTGELVSREQYDGGNNWTIYWNYTLDEKGNAIAEEFNRVGNSPWASITTYTWGYGYENSASSQGAGSSEDGDDSSSSTWLILLIIILILATAFMIYSRTQLDNVSTLAKVDTNKIIKKLLEEE